MDAWDGDPDPNFDEEMAQGFVGKYLLVGITRVTNDGEVISQEQLHGVIIAVTAHGLDIELKGVNEGTVWRMPPFLDELDPAKPGIYTLQSTGEVVEDPDFVFSVTIKKPVEQ